MAHHHTTVFKTVRQPNAAAPSIWRREWVLTPRGSCETSGLANQPDYRSGISPICRPFRHINIMCRISITTSTRSWCG